ncbi:hypothetical protein ACHAP7_000586 [Fusarium lateritium]
MGRFSSARDPNYIKVAGELISVYKSVENDAIQKNTNLASQVIPLDTTNKIPTDLHHQQDMVFQKLRFQNMGSRHSSPPPYWSRLPQEYDWLVEGIPELEWTEAELELRLEGLLLGLSHENVLIFIDALDELNKAKVRSQVRFWKKRVDWPELANLRVCLSCRHIPHIWINNSLELVLEDQNRSDISAHVDFELGMQIPAEESLWKIELAERISVLSNGVFLWVVLVVDTVLTKHDEGSSLVAILPHVNQMPIELGELYTQIIQALPTTEKAVTSKMFQWALGAARPLRLGEWHHILGFIREPAPKSL